MQSPEQHHLAGAVVDLRVEAAGQALPQSDPATGSFYGVVNDRGGELTVRLWVTAGEKGPVLDSDEVVLGLGVYSEGIETRPGDFTVPQLYEYDGHLWQPFTMVLSEPGDRSLRMAGDGDRDRPVLAVGFHSARGTVVVEHSVTGEGARLKGGEGGEAVIGLLSLPSDSVSMRMLGDVPGDASMGIVLFERFG